MRRVAPVRRVLKAAEARSRHAGSSSTTSPIREIPAGEFKARCLALMDDVQRSGGEYVITKRGVPVARLLPAGLERRPMLGCLKGTVSTVGDLVRPLDEPWGALDGWKDED